MYVTTPKYKIEMINIMSDYRLLMYVTTPKWSLFMKEKIYNYRLLMYVTTPKCQIQGFFDIFNLNCF